MKKNNSTPKNKNRKVEKGKLTKRSKRPISDCKLNALLHLHKSPNNLVVYKGSAISNLGDGFTLRCFQRLSKPHIAAQQCYRRNNWWTRGASIPVLSY